MSLGGGGPGIGSGACPNTGNALRNSICQATAAGITVVAAAGNENADMMSSQPGAFPEVLTVTAMADRDGRPGEQRMPKLPGALFAWSYVKPEGL